MCIHTHTCIYAYMNTCIHANMLICIYIYIYICTYMHIYIYTCMYVYIYIYIYIYTPISTPMHIMYMYLNIRYTCAYIYTLHACISCAYLVFIYTCTHAQRSMHAYVDCLSASRGGIVRTRCHPRNELEHMMSVCRHAFTSGI